MEKLRLFLQDGGVAALRVEGKFAFDSANHRDFLGACLGTGIERSRVGDILVQGEQGAQIMVAPELAEHLELNLVQVGSTSPAHPADNHAQISSRQHPCLFPPPLHLYIYLISAQNRSGSLRSYLKKVEAHRIWKVPPQLCSHISKQDMSHGQK